MPPISVKHFGAEIIRKKLESIPREATQPIRDAMMDGGRLVADRAKVLVRKDKRVVERSIRPEFVTTDKRSNVPLLKVSSSAEVLKKNKRSEMLPRWIEFGTASYAKGVKTRSSILKSGRVRVYKRKSASAREHRGMPARPFLMPAWKQTKKEVRAKIAKALNQTLRKVASK